MLQEYPAMSAEGTQVVSKLVEKNHTYKASVWLYVE